MLATHKVRISPVFVGTCSPEKSEEIWTLNSELHSSWAAWLARVMVVVSKCRVVNSVETVGLHFPSGSFVGVEGFLPLCLLFNFLNTRMNQPSLALWVNFLGISLFYGIVRYCFISFWTRLISRHCSVPFSPPFFKPHPLSFVIYMATSVPVNCLLLTLLFYVRSLKKFHQLCYQ